MVTNDTKLGWNCNNDEEKGKYNSKIIPTVTWLWSPHHVKQQVLKFRLGTYSTPQEGLLHIRHCLRNCAHSSWGGTKTRHLKRAAEGWAYAQGYSVRYWWWGKVGFSTVLTWVVKCILCPQNVRPIFFSWYGRNYSQSFPEGNLR